jgi:hypothetical protein
MNSFHVLEWMRAQKCTSTPQTRTVIRNADPALEFFFDPDFGMEPLFINLDVDDIDKEEEEEYETPEEVDEPTLRQRFLNPPPADKKEHAALRRKRVETIRQKNRLRRRRLGTEWRQDIRDALNRVPTDE